MPTVVGKGANGSSNGGSVSLNFADFSYTPLEDDIVFLFGGFGSETSGAIGPSTSGYTLVDSYDGHLSNHTCFGVWRKTMGATPDTNVTGQGSGDTSDAVVYGFYAVRDADTSNPFDVTTVLAGPTTSANPDAPSITTVTNDTLVVIMAGNQVADGAITVPTGYTNSTNNSLSDSFPFSIAVASKALASAGVENPASWTDWSSGTWIAITMAIKGVVTSAIKTIDGLAKGSSKTVNGLAIASIKNINGLE